jgi:hypothetical protein
MISVYHVEGDGSYMEAVVSYLKEGSKVDFKVTGYGDINSLLVDLTGGCRADVYILGDKIPDSAGSANIVNISEVVSQIRSICPDAKVVALIDTFNSTELEMLEIFGLHVIDKGSALRYLIKTILEIVQDN